MKISGSNFFKRAFLAASAGFLCLSLASASSANAQRLPDTVRPEHYTLTLTPDLKAATFSGVESIDVDRQGAGELHHPQRRRDRLPVRHRDRRGKEQTATVTLDQNKQQATFTFPEKLARGQGHARHPLHRHSEQRAARLLSLQKRPPQLRRHAVRVHRRAPRLPQLRRASFQGHL